MERFELCHECTKSFKKKDLISYKGKYICVDCKPEFFQKIREGIATRNAVEYAGFWIRVAAKLIDGVILAVMGLLIVIPFFFFATTALRNTGDPNPGNPQFVIAIFAYYAITLALQALYPTFFVGKYAATPGKMMVGIQVLRSDGGRVSYLRAFARFWAELLSGMTLYIGYIMVGFTDEKTGLHDLICDTRVVYKTN
ncbi:MAG: hypothetical protein CR997_06675 [Acidobacteria bacterium]|nr:MAG: hypothetical protein CR997_06675 [Acidobacteriota bacterium]